MNRREFTISAASMVALPTIPTSATAALTETSRAETVMWAVGSNGEFNWQAVKAKSAADAVLAFAKQEGFIDPETGLPSSSIEFKRCAAWDNLTREPNAGDWLRADMGHICSRCGHETCTDEGYAIEREAVCDECMTLDDYKIVDPERAEEMLLDAAD